MNFQRILVPIAVVGMVVWAWHTQGWMGVAAVASAGVMWLLLWFTRVVQLMRRASKRPVGFVDSAVMLNAKLKTGMTLMHVIALSRALGLLESPKNAQPEIFSWRDGSQSVVRCVFVQGRLDSWTLDRPLQAVDVQPSQHAAND
jgi:hypothetical protein